MTKRCMIDIETLGTDNDAVIIQIGAVIFNEQGMLETFESKINVDCQQERSTTAGTLAFWFKQDVSLYDVIGDEDLQVALMRLKKFLKGKKVEEFWSKGSFDFNLLDNAFKSYSMRPPWHYGQVRCFRTMFKLPVPRNIDKNETLHDALSDAIHQATELNEILNAISYLWKETQTAKQECNE